MHQSAAGAAGLSLKADQCQHSVNPVSTGNTVWNPSQLASSWLSKMVSSKWQKVTFLSDSLRIFFFGCLFGTDLGSKLRASFLKLAALGPVSINLSLIPASSLASNLNWKLTKSIKPAWDKSSLHCQPCKYTDSDWAQMCQWTKDAPSESRPTGLGKWWEDTCWTQVLAVGFKWPGIIQVTTHASQEVNILHSPKMTNKPPPIWLQWHILHAPSNILPIKIAQIFYVPPRALQIPMYHSNILGTPISYYSLIPMCSLFILEFSRTSAISGQ